MIRISLIVIFIYSYCYVCSVQYILFSSCHHALFGHADGRFSVFLPQLQDKWQCITRKNEHGPHYSYVVNCVFLYIAFFYCVFYELCFSMCFFVDCVFLYMVFFLNMYCTTATGSQTNCSYQMYHIITHIIYHY